ncbi:hypothetical protein KBD70_00580 [Candidatus Saccharibacteria bacterium]|nr:hypothetical protein [Candidatus Saccharibacteria bacterium]MBP9985778.1 hypothetical protein [Candidatus Saccharibacteria bacterium]
MNKYSNGKSFHAFWPTLIYLLGLFVVLVGVTIPALAVTPVSQSYLTDKTIPLGSLVALDGDSADKVIPADPDSVKNLIGVTINDSTPLVLTSGNSNSALVATSGIAPTLVSNLNGEIELGDQITASPIAGVGMKATTNTKVIGVAQSQVSSKKTETVNVNGKDEEIEIGEIRLLVSVGYHYQEPEKTLIPLALQNIANAMAGKKVDPLPIIISLIIFIVTMIIVISLVYSIVRSSIISVGRNPLAQSAVYRNAIQMSVLVLAIIAVATIAIYLVLTKL